MAPVHCRADGRSGISLAQSVRPTRGRVAADNSDSVDIARFDGLRILTIDAIERTDSRSVRIPNLLGLHARPAAEMSIQLRDRPGQGRS